jgi:hypothetical protein
MMTRHWQIPILKDGKHVRLFVTTTRDMIEMDLGGDPNRSLIRNARQYHRHGQDEEQNHRDLAIGAIMSFAGCPPYDISDTHVAASDTVPQAQVHCYVGGRGGNSLVPIWEMPADDDDDGDFVPILTM